jgi:hydrogen peroxide-dependent heme synthase
VSDTIYAYYPVFRSAGSPAGGDLDQEVYEAEILFKEWAERVTVRGTYSTVAFRPDDRLMMWWVARAPEDIQDLMVAFRRTGLGRRLGQSHAFLGLVRPAEFTPDHAPAFVKGEAPRKYLCVYPFVRTPDWYLLAPEERSALLREHGEIGRRFPEVLANTTSAFGLSDWEWILAFESDQLESIVGAIRELRIAEARRFTKLEVPFITGIRKELAAAARDL